MLRVSIAILNILYVLCVFGSAAYGFHSLLMTVLYLQTKKRGEPSHPPCTLKEWPRVTVQLPIFNERFTVERLLSAVVKLDYPRDRFQIQILDDSTDDTTSLVRHLAEQYHAQGLNIELIHRTDRSGFKAGALHEGLKTATGELLAIFDADFVPGPDWLRRTVPEFSDPGLGCLQTRWGHLNAGYNSFTRSLALATDGHFVVEQTARSRNGLLMNFNGTAGLWRRACIEDAGGWASDTLTEDLDLSYRAQLRGWHIGYLPDVVVPAELPVQIEAFKQQQHRWAKGSFQAVRKLVPALTRANIPERTRLLGLVHLTGYLIHPLMLLTLLLILPVGLLSPNSFRLFSWTIAASFGPPFLYLVSRTEVAPKLSDRLRALPLLVLIGFGLSFSNTVAVCEGLFGRSTGTFVRTPKFNVTARQQNWMRTNYTMPVSLTTWVELGLCAYALIALFVLTPHVGLGIAPWLLIYAASFGYIGGLSLLQNRQMHQFTKSTRLSPLAERKSI